MINSKEFDKLMKPIPFDSLLDRRIDKKKLVKNKDGTFTYRGRLDLSRLNLKSLEFLKPFNISIVKGNFYCSNNQLTSLEGAPIKIGGYFDCNTNRLTNLEGAPKSVGGYFYCHTNRLTNLEGASKSVGGGFYCSDNKVSIEKLKRTVKRDYLN